MTRHTHIDIHVEDASGKRMLEILLEKISGGQRFFTFEIFAYKGIGRIPRGMKPGTEASKRILLDRLPGILKGHGESHRNDSANYRRCVFVICDLGQKCLKMFREELHAVLNRCVPVPETYFCIAVEEGEAWLLGDRAAILAAYPLAKRNVLENYQQDSICGTWEVLADAIYPGGRKILEDASWWECGQAKCAWAEKITPHMDPERNISESFQYFMEKIRTIKDNHVTRN